MKKLLVSILLSALALVVFAQKIPQTQVPDAVTKTFAAAYPEALEIGWEKKSELYKADFDIGKTGHDVWIDNAGKIVKHRYEIKSADLPEAARQTIAKDYAAYKTRDIEKTETGKLVTYKVGLKSPTGKTSIHFDASGKLIEKKAD